MAVKGLAQEPKRCGNKNADIDSAKPNKEWSEKNMFGDNPSDLWVFPKIRGKPPKWMVYKFIMENLIKMGWFGGFSHYFRKHPYQPHSCFAWFRLSLAGFPPWEKSTHSFGTCAKLTTEVDHHGYSWHVWSNPQKKQGWRVGYDK